MDNKEISRLSGTVIYLRTNEGSKSECVAPFLYQGRDVGTTRLMLKDDNPFENRGFLAFDGQAVEVSGKFGNGGTFIADDIRMNPADKNDGEKII